MEPMVNKTYLCYPKLIYEGIKVNRLFQYRIAMSKPGGGTG